MTSLYACSFYPGITPPPTQGTLLKTQSKLLCTRLLHYILFRPGTSIDFFFAFPAMMPRGAQENNDENVIDHSHEKQSQLEGHHRLS